jgi:hypothetical protein
MAAMRPILVFSLLFSLPALADDPPAPAVTPAAPVKKEDAAKADPGAANMLVTKDPVTGKLRPATAAEREKLLGRTPLVSPEPEVVTLPDGTILMKVRPEERLFAVAKRNPDGTLSYACVHAADAAAAPAATSAPAPSPAPKKADR